MAGGCFPPCGDAVPVQLPSPWPVATVPAGTVVAAKPSVLDLGPGYAVAQSPAPFTLYVSGQNFTQGSVISFDGAPVPTKFMGSTLLAAEIDGSAQTVGSVAVLVTNPDAAVSNTVQFPFIAQVPLIAEPKTEAA